METSGGKVVCGPPVLSWESHHPRATSTVLSFALTKKWLWLQDSRKRKGEQKERGRHTARGGGLSAEQALPARLSTTAVRRPLPTAAGLRAAAGTG